MRILYDGMIYAGQPAGGINRYFANLIDRLPSTVEPTLTTVFLRGANFPQRPGLQFRYFQRFRPSRISNSLEKWYFRWASRGYDIIHPTYYSTLSREMPFRALGAKVVVTVWDMVHELFPPVMDPNGTEAACKRNAIRAADALLCISENTRQDLLRFYPEVSSDKVYVTRLATEFNFDMTTGNEPVPSAPYLLYVGQRFSLYKNFSGLLRAFARLAPTHRDLILCVVGGGPFKTEEEALIGELRLCKRVRHLGYLPDAHLAKVYRRAQVFVYPSLYEGFGIPPLEAMSCGVPVVVADRSSLPEVVGDAALRFDPDSPDDLTETLEALLNSSAQQENLIRKGFERATLFSWERTTEETVRVYEALRMSTRTGTGRSSKWQRVSRKRPDPDGSIEKTCCESARSPFD